MDKRTIKITGPGYLDNWSVELDINNPLVKDVLEQLVAFKRLSTVIAAYLAKQPVKHSIPDPYSLRKEQPWQPEMLSPTLELRRTEYGDTWRHISSTLTLSVAKDGNWLLNTGEYPRVAKYVFPVYIADFDGRRSSRSVEGANAGSHKILFVNRDQVLEQRRGRQALGHTLSEEHKDGLFHAVLR